MHEEDFKKVESDIKVKLNKDLIDVDVNFAQLFLEVDTAHIKILLQMLDDLEVL